MPNPSLDHDQIQAIKTLMIAGRDPSGHRWTSRRIGSALGIHPVTVRSHQARIRRESERVVQSKELIAARMVQARQLIGLEE